MSTEINPFKWAHDEEANIQEPIEALKKQGWRYGDVPTASNFNWLFHQIERQLELLSKTSRELAGDANAIKELLRSTTIKANANERSSEFNIGVSRQICRQLREMEKDLQKLHPGFPTQPWPLTDEVLVGLEED